MRRRAVRWGFALLAAAAVLATVCMWRMPEVLAWSWYLSGKKPVLNARLPQLSDGLRWFDDYYVVADLGKGAFAIGEPRYWQCNFSYLLVGSRQAILFDTGPGIRDIGKVVHALTSLPVVAMPSHLHFDHIGNLSRFAHVALPDLPALRAQVRNGQFELGFYQYLGFVEGFKRPTFTVTHWVAPGAEFDLGGRRVMLLSVPGHTPDSVVLLDRQENRVFAGDFIYPSEIYAALPGANLRDYSTSAQRVIPYLDSESTILGGHGCDHLPTLDVPTLGRSDVIALENALQLADTNWGAGTGWYPRQILVNHRMMLSAKYPWMLP